MITIRNIDGTTVDIDITELAAEHLKKIGAIAKGWGFGRMVLPPPVPQFVPLDGEPAAPKAKRDKAADDAATEQVRLYIQGAGTHTVKVVCSVLGITCAQFSAAKKALVKSGAAVDMGKGRISGKAAQS